MNNLASFLKNCKISRVENAAAASTTDADTDVLDMSGYDSIAFVALLGDATSGSVLELKVYGNTANSTSSPTPVELTNDDVQYTAAASDADNKIMIADVPQWNATYRYAFGRLVIDTQNCVLDGILAIQYNARDLPVTQGSTVLAAALASAAA